MERLMQVLEVIGNPATRQGIAVLAAADAKGTNRIVIEMSYVGYLEKAAWVIEAALQRMNESGDAR